MLEDSQLLRRYVDDRSEEAFTELVRRHLSLVYFAALRRVGGDRHLADDVAQRVFADLARKAATLVDRPALTGWLYTSTRFAAAQAVRTEQRRRTHEQEAQTMNELTTTTESDWNQLRPVIDAALDDLSEPDREAVLLRFFENLPLADVGARFAVSPDAARMRVDRALDKLRASLARRGIASTSTALAAVFLGQSGLAAPAGLLAKIVAGALQQAGAATATVLGLGKIFLGGIAALLAVGLLYEVGRSEHWFAGSPRPAPAIASLPGAPVAVTSTVIAPAATAAVPPTPSAGPSNDFAPLSDAEKGILKRLWDVSRNYLGPAGTQPGLPDLAQAPDNAITGAAVGRLEAQGWVRIGAQKGLVVLTASGRDFCAAQAAALAAYPAFNGLPAEEKNLIRKLWTIQQSHLGEPGTALVFRVMPGAPRFPEFAASAGALESDGVVRTAKNGGAYLTPAGLDYLALYQEAIAAYPPDYRE